MRELIATKDCEIGNSTTSGCEIIPPTEGGRRNSLIAIIIVGFFLMTSIQVIISEAALAEPGPRIWTIGMTEAVLSANPFTGIYDADYLFYSYVYDSLITPNEDGIATPNLATSWWLMDGLNASTQLIPTDFSTLQKNKNPTDWPSGSIWEYNLTEDVFWSDGEPFTADDVIFTIKMQIGENYATLWAYQPYTRCIFDAQRVNDYKVRVFFADHATEKPTPIAWGYSLNMGIYPEHVMKDMSPAYIAQTWDGTRTVGLGAFRGTDNLKSEIIGGESVTLVRNSYYNFTDPTDGKQKGLGYIWKRPIEIDNIIMKFYSEDAALNLDLRRGDIDACKLASVSYMALKNLADKPKELNLVSMLSCTVYSEIVHWNMYKGVRASQNPARADPAIWRASALAVNKTHIVDQCLKGLGMPAVGIISPVWPEWYWTPGNEPSTFNVTNGKNATDPDYDLLYSYTKPMKNVMDFDLDTANEILDAAGYVWNDDHTVREIGPVAAQRLKNMSIILDITDILGMELHFNDIIGADDSLDRSIGEYQAWEWVNIGIDLVITPVTNAIWGGMVYSYSYDYTPTYWSGDVDPNYLLFMPTSYTLGSWNEFGTEDPVYDHYYDMQSQTFNLTERKYWVDQCQKWQYLSGIVFVCYPETSFGYNEIRWTNWGNWSQHPGLAIDYFWGEDPILFHIKYIITGEGPADWMSMIIVVLIAAVVITVAIYIRISRKKKEITMFGEEKEEDLKEQEKT